MPDEHHVAYPAGFIDHRRGAGDSLLLALLRHRAPSRPTHPTKQPVRHLTARGTSSDPTPVCPMTQPRRATPSGGRAMCRGRSRGYRESVMAKIFSVVSRAGFARAFEPIARVLLRAGVSANAVTVAGGAVIVAASGGLVARGRLVPAMIIITLVALTDMLDGAIARASGQTNRFGALLDSTMDRISDGAVFGALAYWLATVGDRWSLAAALVCLVTGQVISYVRARAEGLGFTANVGIAERAERLIIVGLGALAYGLGFHAVLDVALWVLAVLSVITIGQRIVHVWRQAREAGQ